MRSRALWAFLFGLHVLCCHLVKVNGMFGSAIVGFFLLVRVFGAEPAGGMLLEGTGQETLWHRVASGEPGPVVMLVGGVHGNERAGARATEQIRHWTLTRGELIVIPRANVTGLRARIRFVPNRSPATRDLNRNCPKTYDKNETVGELAAGIWRLVEERKPDWLLDLHEGTDFYQINKKSVGSSIIPTRGVGVGPVRLGRLSRR
jgi:predicted deacylase